MINAVSFSSSVVHIDHRCKKVKEEVNSHFNIKVWKTIHEEDEKYPAEWWKTTKDGICTRTHEYINNLQPTGMSKKHDPNSSLSAQELA